MTAASVRLTPLGIMVLALLREGDMHPYEMLRLMQQRRRDRLIALTKGALYHTVARLEQQGLIAEAGVDREGNRPERTIYTLQDLGDELVAEWVRAELPRVDPAGQFRVALAEAHNLPREEVAALLEVRRRTLAADLAGCRSGLADARSRAVAEQFLVDVEREAVLLDAELSWLDGLLARFASGDLLWGAEDCPAPAQYQAQRKAARQ